LIGRLTFELNIPIRGGGSTTFKQRRKRKGFEPDECYWIQHEEHIRGKREFDFATDPPPDLAVEVDFPRRSLNRLPIYAAFKVPEVWHFDGQRLRVQELRQGRYSVRKQSPTFPFLPLGKMEEFIRLLGEEDETSLLRSFAQWIRSEIVPIL
jgi:Uma2 family endonuclease